LFQTFLICVVSNIKTKSSKYMYFELFVFIFDTTQIKKV